MLTDVEHIVGEDAWREREEVLRESICNIIPCDILREDPLFIKQQESFEIIQTSICLEAACKTFAEYKDGVRKLVGLLKPGGFLLMFVEERETFTWSEIKDGVFFTSHLNK